MADMEEVLERQERETRERMRRRAASKRAQRELNEQLGIAVALLEEEKQARRGSREGRRPNVDRHRHSRGMKWSLVQDYRRTGWNNLESLTSLHHLPTMEKLAAVGLKKKFQSERPEAATCQGAVGGTVALI
ncbi:hypothetical protein L3X38_038823 [Prunus dulcis]|uniref:Uncharacterized protein n=1 Tax=Prunus dulcis TaxID=3755 RepID=A0AAD4V626_PRUDU|nr:hypothetical protein L3X38_038823 [Prunus dulcis]